MAVVTPIEDLLANNEPTTLAYHKLKRELNRNMPLRDAKHIAWHLTIPQHIFMDSVNRKASLLPQSDTLSCTFCNTSFSIPMKYPRFHETTLKAFRSVHYLPSPPQECPCGNLKTLTDSKGNLRVYLLNIKEESFALHNGPVDLRICEEYAQGESHYDIAKLFDGPRPTTKDPFSYELRNKLRVNHINLYKVSPVVQAMLLPSGNYREYARLYNIVIFGGDHIYFPTGHAIPSYKFSFSKPLEILDNEIPSQLLSEVVLTERTALLLNKFATYLFTEELPLLLIDNFSALANTLSRKLNIPRSYAPSAPFLPYMIRLQYAVGASSRDRKTKDKNYRPLSVYNEFSILRLPQFSSRDRTSAYHQQDFKYRWRRPSQHKFVPYVVNRKDVLIKLKHDRIRLLRYTLPRLTASPESIHKHAEHLLTHVTLPEHTPTNNLLLRLTSDLTLNTP